MAHRTRFVSRPVVAPHEGVEAVGTQLKVDDRAAESQAHGIGGAILDRTHRIEIASQHPPPGPDDSPHALAFTTAQVQIPRLRLGCQQVEHERQHGLHTGQSARTLRVRPVLLFASVRRVIRADDIDHAICEGAPL